MKKFVVQGEEARTRLLKGINIVGEIVGATLGPAGKNAVLERTGSWPLIINDGYQIAREIHHLEDPIENLGAEILKEVATKTNDKAGDGTTTSVVIAYRLINEVSKRIKDDKSLVKSSKNLMDIYREIKSEALKVIETLKVMAIPIEGKEMVKNVATVALESEELGGMVSDIIDKIGKDGYILVEPSFIGKVESEVIEGMKLNAGLAASWMSTNLQKKESVIKDPALLITNYKLERPLDIQHLVTELSKENKKDLVIIAPKFSKEFLTTVYATAAIEDISRKFYVLCLKAPALDDDEFEDIAVYTNGVFINQNKGMELTNFSVKDLGRADKIIGTEDYTFLIGGKGKKEAIDERIAEIKKHLEDEKIEMFKKKKYWRIGSLASGIGIIRVGAKTDFERDYLKYKIDDAIYATRAALEEGIVKGGGLALKEIADGLPDGHILKSCLLAPYEKIQENNGEELKIEDWVIDPVKVVRVALENAISAASTFLTTSSVVAIQPESLADELKKALNENG